jgi:hypothetical protein
MLRPTVHETGMFSGYDMNKLLHAFLGRTHKQINIDTGKLERSPMTLYLVTRGEI